MSQDDDWPTGEQVKVTEAVAAAPAAEKLVDQGSRARRGAIDTAGTSLVETSTPAASRRASGSTQTVRKSQPVAVQWLRHGVEALVPVIILAAVVFLAGRSSGPTPAPPPRLNITATEFCPSVAAVAGSISAVADSDLKWQPNGGAAVPGSAYFEQAVTTESTLQGTGSVAGVVQFGSGGQIASAACATPAASGYLQAGAANETLFLQNVDAQDAILNVAFLGSAGEIDPPDLVDLTIPAGSVKQINVGDYANGIAPVAVRWQSTVGRVLGWLVANTPTGFDMVAPTSASTEVVVPGVPGGATVQVLITNPATVRIKADVEALTAQGRVPLAGANQVTIEAGSTTAIDVTSALSTDPTALVVTSDQPVAASAWLSHASDTATAPGVLVDQSGGVDAFGVTPGHSQLLISNTTSADTTATVTLGSGGTPQTVPVAAGVTTAVPVPQAGAVRVSGSGIVAALVIRGSDDDASGMSVIALAPDTARAGLTPAWIEAQPRMG